jgi:hypothetical protein
MELSKTEKTSSSVHSSPTGIHGSLSPTGNGIEVRKKRHSHRCATPLNALQLAEDMQRMETALFAIQRIDPSSITRDQNKGWADRAKVIHALKDWHAYSRKVLLEDYLSTPGDESLVIAPPRQC